MKLIRTKLGNDQFFYIKGDKTVGGRIALRKYERFETHLMKNLSREDGIAIDVGANIGYYSLILAKLFPKVSSFEPEPINFELLKKNIECNGLKNVRLSQKAVSDRAETLKLGVSKKNLGDHQIDSVEIGRKQILIQATTLDKEIQQKVALLKIDTQGWEPKVIAGGKKIIARDLPVIFMEFWPTGYRRSKLDYLKMISFLEKKYGCIYLIEDDLEIVYPIKVSALEKKCLTKKGYVDLLFKKKLTMTDRVLFFKKFNIKHFLKKWLTI